MIDALKRLLGDLAATPKPGESGDTHAQRGHEALNRHDYLGATQCFERAIAADLQIYDRAEIQTLLGKSYQRLGQVERSIAAHQKAIEINPQYHKAWNNLGVTYFDAGRLDEAIACHQRAIELDATYSYAYASIGGIYVVKNEPLLAIEYLRKAIELNPGMPTAFSNLSLALAVMNRFDEAYEALKQAIALGYRGWQEVKERIDNLYSFAQDTLGSTKLPGQAHWKKPLSA